jgi:hypothetical protein
MRPQDSGAKKSLARAGASKENLGKSIPMRNWSDRQQQ